MSYSCTDLADTALEAAAALAKAIGHPAPPESAPWQPPQPGCRDEEAEDFNQSPAMQAEYIVEVTQAAAACVLALRAACETASGALDAIANECTPKNPGLAPVFNRVCEETGVSSKLSEALALFPRTPRDVTTAGPVHIAAALPVLHAEVRTYRAPGGGNFYYLEDGTLLSGAVNADGSYDWDNPAEVDPSFLSGDCSEADGGDECLRALLALRDYSWRLTPAGTWVLVNAEGADIGHAYANPSGTWNGEPWGREIRTFNNPEKAKAHVLRMMSR